MTGPVLPRSGRPVPCERCPLRGLPFFRDFDEGELAFVSSFKTGEVTAGQGASVLQEGTHSPHLYTLLSGWAFRYKMLSDGRRQILNYMLPGDLIGLQGTVTGTMEHSVEALTPIVLCLFERERLAELFVNHPGLSFDVTWMAAREERILDDHLLSVGRRTALERAAYIIAFLHSRAMRIGLAKNERLFIPITQVHVADTLGLSTVHTNKTLKKLSDLALIRWHDRSCEVLDPAGLMDLAGWEGEHERKRPFV